MKRTLIQVLIYVILTWLLHYSDGSRNERSDLVHEVYPIVFDSCASFNYTWRHGECNWFMDNAPYTPSGCSNDRSSDGAWSRCGTVELSKRTYSLRFNHTYLVQINCSSNYRGFEQTRYYKIRVPLVHAKSLKEANEFLNKTGLKSYVPLSKACMKSSLKFSQLNYNSETGHSNDHLTLCKDSELFIYRKVEVVVTQSDKVDEVPCSFDGFPRSRPNYYVNGTRVNPGTIKFTSNQVQPSWWECEISNQNGATYGYKLQLFYPRNISLRVREFDPREIKMTEISSINIRCPVLWNSAVIANGRWRMVLWLKAAKKTLRLKLAEKEFSNHSTIVMRKSELKSWKSIWCIACWMQGRGRNITCNIYSFDKPDDWVEVNLNVTRPAFVVTSLSSHLDQDKMEEKDTNLIWMFVLFSVSVFIFLTITIVLLVCRRYQFFRLNRKDEHDTSNHENATDYVALRKPCKVEKRISCDSGVVQNCNNSSQPVRFVRIRDTICGTATADYGRRHVSRNSLVHSVNSAQVTFDRSRNDSNDSGMQENEVLFNIEYVSLNKDKVEPYVEDAWEINRSRITFLRELGSGAFGRVFLAWLDSGTSNQNQIAVKESKDDYDSCSYTSNGCKCPSNTIAQLLQEIEIMKSVGYHDNVIRFVGCSILSSMRKPLLIMEYCSSGNLLNFLREKRELFNGNEANKMDDISQMYMLFKKFAIQIACGMKFLTDMNFIHRDLAARNVLLTENLMCKLCDFGLSRHLQRNEEYYMQLRGKLPLRWMAPEIVLSSGRPRYSIKSDVWSYGILLWEIYTFGCQPYPNYKIDEIIGILATGYRMPIPKDCPTYIGEIIEDCWQFEHTYRPSFSDILRRIPH